MGEVGEYGLRRDENSVVVAYWERKKAAKNESNLVRREADKVQAKPEYDGRWLPYFCIASLAALARKPERVR